MVAGAGLGDARKRANPDQRGAVERGPVVVACGRSGLITRTDRVAGRPDPTGPYPFRVRPADPLARSDEVAAGGGCLLSKCGPAVERPASCRGVGRQNPVPSPSHHGRNRRATEGQK